MDFLQGNWFSLLTVISVGVGYLWRRGKRDGKMDEVISKVDGFEKVIESKIKQSADGVSNKIDQVTMALASHERKFNDHVANKDIHVTDMLLELLKERHDYNKNEFANTRTDIQRVESLINDMMAPRR